MTQNLPEKTEKEMAYTMDNGDEMKLTMSMVKKYLVQGHAEYVTDSELLFFMHECKARKLNPFLRQCWLIKYSQGDNAQIVESISHKRNKARKAPDCEGWEKGLIMTDKEGAMKRSKGLVQEGDTVLGAYFTAKPKGWQAPYELEINLGGYIKKKRDGSTTQFWQKEKQPSQIMKVVESQGLSALWGDTIGTAYIPEELPAPIDFTPDKNGMYETAPKPDAIVAFDKLVENKGGGYPSFVPFLIETAKGNKLSVDELKAQAVEQFDELWMAYLDWQAKKPVEKVKTEEPGSESKPDPADPWDEQNWTNLRKPGFATHVHKNLATFPDAPAKIQAKVIDKWHKPNFYSDTPFPTIRPPNVPKEGDKESKAPITPGKGSESVTTPVNEIPAPPKEPDQTIKPGGFPLTDEAVKALGPDGPEIYGKACDELNFKDGPFSDVTDKAISSRMSTIADRDDTEGK